MAFRQDMLNQQRMLTQRLVLLLMVRTPQLRPSSWKLSARVVRKGRFWHILKTTLISRQLMNINIDYMSTFK